MLADLGADVVKVEPPGGEEFRGSGLWTLVGRNKRFVSLDYRTEAVLLHRLTAAADIVLTNQPAGLLERMGCTYEDISGRNPGVVMVHVSGWGTSGPYADLTGNGTLGEAFAGLTGLQRHADGVPRLSPVLMGDHLTALAGVIGALAACYWRDARGGKGQLVDVALYEAVLGLLGPQIVQSEQRSGSGIRDTFATADGRWVAVTSYSRSQVDRLLSAVEASADDPTEAVAGWIGANDLETVLAAFREARIGIAPVNDLSSVIADPHVVVRRAIHELTDPELGTVRIPDPAPHMTGSPAQLDSLPKPVGADNEAVWADWLT